MVEFDLLADDLGITKEMCVPELVGQDGHGIGFASVVGVGRKQAAAEQCGYTQVIKAGRDERNGDDVLRVIVAGDGGGVKVHREYVVYDGRLLKLTQLQSIEID